MGQRLQGAAAAVHTDIMKGRGWVLEAAVPCRASRVLGWAWCSSGSSPCVAGCEVFSSQPGMSD